MGPYPILIYPRRREVAGVNQQTNKINKPKSGFCFQAATEDPHERPKKPPENQSALHLPKIIQFILVRINLLSPRRIFYLDDTVGLSSAADLRGRRPRGQWHLLLNNAGLKLEKMSLWWEQIIVQIALR